MVLLKKLKEERWKEQKNHYGWNQFCYVYVDLESACFNFLVLKFFT